MMEKNNYAVAAAGLLVVALALGGAGVNFPLLEMVLDLVALGVAASFIWVRGAERLTTLGRCALALAIALIALPALQLVPLPPGLWQALPGRELPTSIDAALGISTWRPLTLDVEGTVRALLNLIPACVIFFAALHLHTPGRARLLAIVALFALLNAILGIAQLATGGSMTPFPSSHIGYPLGLFVNRNHNAAFLLVSMPLIAALGARRAQGSQSRLAYIVATLAALTILAVVVIGTTSRMALALLPLALAGSLAILFFRQSLWRVATPSVLVLAGVAATISWVGGFNRNLARFSSLHDSRFDYWNDVSWALQHYGHAGTGFGSFIPVYETAESLSSVSPQILNHAHNDFIEVILEGGFPAALLLLFFFAIIAVAAIRLARKRFEFSRASISLAAAVGIVTILIFSLVDYPLRMPAISCTFAILCACLLPAPVPAAHGTSLVALKDRGQGPEKSRRRLIIQLAGSAVVLILALITIQSGVSAASLLADRDSTAAAFAFWSTAAHESLASDALVSARPEEAGSEAILALRLSPINAVALRSAAVARTMGGDPAAGERLMQIAATLGWRDPLTQVWVIEASARMGEPDKAIERAEALFQQDIFLPSAIILLVQDAPDGPVSRSLVKLLESRPDWRSSWMKAAAQLPARYVPNVTLVAAKLNRGSAPLSVAEQQPLLDRLIQMGNIEGARLLWSGSHRNGLVANGGFEGVSSRSGADSPTDWDVADEDLATIAIQRPPFPGHSRALRISPAARSGPILSQRLMLAPGSYSLRFRARSGGAPGVVLRWRLSCLSSDQGETAQEPPAMSSGWQEFRSQLIVPVQDCPIQRLALERPNDIRSPEVWVDDVTLMATSG